MQSLALVIRWNTTYLQFIYFGTLPLLAAFSRLLFWRNNRNLTEWWVLGLYTYAEVYLIQLICICVISVLPGKIGPRFFATISAASPFVMFTWGAVQFVNAPAWSSIIRSFIANVMYTIVVSVSMLAIAITYIQHTQQTSTTATSPASIAASAP